MDERRQQRVADAIREELSELVVYELADPQIRLLGITGVHLSPDGKKADVLVRIEGDEKRRDATLAALGKATGYLRHQLASRLSLRQAPDLRFVSDTGAASNERMESLLKKAQHWRRKLDAATAEGDASAGSAAPPKADPR
ncbi:MAG: 30S ribosome-binding factor RbfA [Bryobacterales bacterium]|nr:30S ribosome-binding factor RbfA [Bryobacterales bacterium]